MKPLTHAHAREKNIQIRPWVSLGDAVSLIIERLRAAMRKS